MDACEKKKFAETENFKDEKAKMRGREWGLGTRDWGLGTDDLKTGLKALVISN
jgi:hypothetical protein